VGATLNTIFWHVTTHTHKHPEITAKISSTHLYFLELQCRLFYAEKTVAQYAYTLMCLPLHTCKHTNIHIIQTALPKIKLFVLFCDELWLTRQTGKFFHYTDPNKLHRGNVTSESEFCTVVPNIY
jgi:hypothetical protein